MRKDDMKKTLFTAAVMVALVGCSKSSSDRMGSAADREVGTSTSSTADTTSIRQNTLTVTNDASGISGSGSIESANSGAAAGSIQTPPPPTTSDTTIINQNSSTTTDQSGQGSAGASASGTFDVTPAPSQPSEPAQPQQQ